MLPMYSEVTRDAMLVILLQLVSRDETHRLGRRCCCDDDCPRGQKSDPEAECKSDMIHWPCPYVPELPCVAAAEDDIVLVWSARLQAVVPSVATMNRRKHRLRYWGGGCWAEEGTGWAVLLGPLTRASWSRPSVRSHRHCFLTPDMMSLLCSWG